MSKAQNPYLGNVWGPLRLDEFNPPLPNLDPGQMSPTYEISAAWVDLHPIHLYLDGGIAGSTLERTVSTQFSLTPGFEAVDISLYQVYWGASVRFYGGATTPLGFSWLIKAAGSNYPLTTSYVRNPGGSVGGPLIIPPTMDLTLSTLTNGGTGDGITATVWGAQYAAGLPPPLAPVTMGGNFA
jgi:hypothetical protein